MGKTAILAVRIISDAKNAVKGMQEAGAAAGGFGEKVGALGPKAMAFGAATVGAFVAAGKALYDVGAKFDEVDDTIRVGTGATGQALEGLQEVARAVGRQTPAAFEAIAPAVADLNTTLGYTGITLETVTRQVLELGRLTGTEVNVRDLSSTFKGFGVAAGEAESAMDDLFRVSQATGVPVNELTAKLKTQGGILKTVGLGFTDSAALLGVLSKAGVNADTVIKGIGAGLVRLAKSGEQPAQAFKRVVGEIDGFIKSGNDAAALSKAGEVFGTRGATQFVAALKTGKVSLEDMTKAADLTGDTILGVADETRDFDEAWLILKNNVLTILEPLGTAIFNTVGQAAGALAGFLQSIDLAPLQKALAPVGEALGRVFEAIGPAVESFLPTLKEMAQGFVPVVTAGQSLLPVLPTIGRALMDLGKGIADTVGPLLKDFATKILPPVSAAIAGMMAKVGPAVASLFPVLSKLVTALGPVITGIGQFLMPVIQALLPVVMTVFSTIGTVISGAVQFISGIINTFVAVISGNWSGVWDGIKQTVSGAWTAITGLITGAFNIIGGLFSAVGTTLKTIWTGAWTAIKAVVSGAFRSISTAVSTGISTVISAVKGLPGKARSALGSIGTTLYQAGKDLISGFINGIGAMGTALWDAAKAIGSSALTAIKKSLGIASPSKKAFQLGRFVSQGFILGINSVSSAPAYANLINPPRLPLPAQHNAPAGKATPPVHIEINGAIDPVSTAKQIRSLLTSLDRLAGPVRIA